MMVDILAHLSPRWTVAVAQPGNLIHVFDGKDDSYYAAFGGAVDRWDMHRQESISKFQASQHEFKELAAWIPGSPSNLTLVLVILQEGDELKDGALVALETGAATYTIDSMFADDMEIVMVSLLRHTDGEFKIIGFVGPKSGR